MDNAKKKDYVYTPVYSEVQEELINKEFSRIKDECYLEHAGATLYSEQQLSDVFLELSSNMYGNPHARNKSSKYSEDVIDQIRFKILQHFNTNSDEYTVIFTSGATAALKLVAESFQYQTQGSFVCLCDNHTSVLGMRGYAPNVVSLDCKDAFEVFDRGCKTPTAEDHSCNSLFVYPAESNFSGTKYPLSWIKKAQDGVLGSCDKVGKGSKWFCMLDAACYVSTNYFDLTKYRPDFICLSFYKIFGYPTGLGALLVRNSSSYVLEKVYFGGGTVLMALAGEQTHVPRPTIHERFEDGTLPFLSIISLRHGFELFERLTITMDEISRHTYNLAAYVYHTLTTLHHANGEPVVLFYHDGNFSNRSQQGGIINFNLLRPNGGHVGYSEVLHVSNLYGIHLRTGCFCNPGACQSHLKLSAEDVKYHFNSGHVCGDQNDLIDGYPTGSVRISFGYMSMKQDADRFLYMINEYFISKPIEPYHITTYQTTGKDISKARIGQFSECKGVLKQIFIYPVKSCAAFEITDDWKVVRTGLQYDRQWMVINFNGVAMTQKTVSNLAVIKPRILLKQNLLELSCEDFPSLTLPLDQETVIPSTKCQSKVCRDRVQGLDCGNDVAKWLDDVLGLPGLRLLQQHTKTDEPIRKYKKDDYVQLSLSNEAQFLLINLASVQWLMDHITTGDDFGGLIDNVTARFRPNLVVEFPEPFVENSFSTLEICELSFVNKGACTRCQMICINQSTGEKTIEPLRTLSKVFNGKIRFGVYLNNTSASCGVLNRNDSVVGFVNFSQ